MYTSDCFSWHFMWKLYVFVVVELHLPTIPASLFGSGKHPTVYLLTGSFDNLVLTDFFAMKKTGLSVISNFSVFAWDGNFILCKNYSKAVSVNKKCVSFKWVTLLTSQHHVLYRTKLFICLQIKGIYFHNFLIVFTILYLTMGLFFHWSACCWCLFVFRFKCEKL